MDRNPTYGKTSGTRISLFAKVLGMLNYDVALKIQDSVAKAQRTLQTAHHILSDIQYVKLEQRMQTVCCDTDRRDALRGCGAALFQSALLTKIGSCA